MYNPYTPPKAKLDVEKPVGRFNRYWRMVNYIYGVAVGGLFLILLTKGEIKPELPDLVVLSILFAPVFGCLFASISIGRWYKVWLVIHWLIVTTLLIFVLYSPHQGRSSFITAVTMLLINLVSVITNHHLQKKNIL